MGRYFILANNITGQLVSIDTYARRLGRMRSKVFTWAEQVKLYYPDAECKMITLTYDTHGTLGQVFLPEANDIKKFNKVFRSRLGKKLLAYAWVSEVMQNGTLHYHYLAVVKPGTKVPYPDSEGLWFKGMSNIKNSESGVYYICGHLQKKYQKNFSKFPKGCRLFGVWIRGKMESLRDEFNKKYYSPLKSEGWQANYHFARCSDFDTIQALENNDTYIPGTDIFF